jgi:hypothetical protein
MEGEKDKECGGGVDINSANRKIKVPLWNLVFAQNTREEEKPVFDLDKVKNLQKVALPEVVFGFWSHVIDGNSRLIPRFRLDMMRPVDTSGSATTMQATGDPSAAFPSSQIDTAILLATLPNLSNPHFLAPVITSATTHTRKRLIIVLFSRHFNVHYPRKFKKTQITLTFPENQALSHTKSWDAVQRILTFTYVQATKIAHEMNKVLMDIDVLVTGLNEDLNEHLGKGVDICFRVSGGMSFPNISPHVWH